MPETYVVVVRDNLVCAIEPGGPPSSTPITPLEVATQLAENYRSAGCIDGRYRYDDAMHARTFAELCCEFVAALVEKRATAIRALPAGNPEYRAEN